MKQKILIISATFPPLPGVGGRRWAKFAKYLNRSGEEVFVLTSKVSKEATSPWDEDIKGLKITRIPVWSPFFSNSKSAFVQKVFYKLGNLIIPFLTKGSIYDKTLLAKSKIINSASKIIEHNNVDTLIISGAPFRTLWYGTFLKKKYPAITFIADLRDPWSWGNRAYGFDALSPQRRAFEKKLEQEVVESADRITAPGDPMVNQLKLLYPNHQDKISLLPHGFDLDEIAINKKSPNPKKIKLIYFGTLYEALEDHFEGLAEVFAKYPNQFALTIYSSTQRYKEIFEAYGVESMVNYFTPLPTKLLFEEVSKMDYALLFKLKHYGADNISTKYYELIASKTSILLLGPEGQASRLITANNLGHHFPVKRIVSAFSLLAERKLDLNYNSNFDVDEFSFQNITENLLEMINQKHEETTH